MKINTVNLKIRNKDIHFNFRNDSVADKGVIGQIFVNGDYNISQWPQGAKLMEYHQTQSRTRPSLIVDAGANIGASVIYFSEIYENSRIFSIEPDLTNWHLLELNTSGHDNIYNFHGAISNTDGELKLLDPGRSDWGFMTQPLDEQTDDKTNVVNVVRSISPDSILNHPSTQDTTPLIFKIDIEGGEARLFDGDTSWMKKFPLIIIELHDWMLPFQGISRNFLKATTKHHFDLVHRGENIFLFNADILF